MKFTPSAAVTITADRHEVDRAVLWDDASGSDFFMEPDAAQIAGTGGAEDLSDVGWTITGLGFVGPTKSADFLSLSGIGVPGHYEGNSAGDVMQSPAVFGDYPHGLQASHHLGKLPTSLSLEQWATWSVRSASETATCLGFCDADGSIIVAADAIAAIHSDGTNFVLRSTADSDVGALVDGDIHLFKIVVQLIGSLTDAIEWFIDGVSQGTIDLLDNVWPAAVGCGNLSAGTNRILIGGWHLDYR